MSNDSQDPYDTGALRKRECVSGLGPDTHATLRYKIEELEKALVTEKAKWGTLIDFLDDLSTDDKLGARSRVIVLDMISLINGVSSNKILSPSTPYPPGTRYGLVQRKNLKGGTDA